MKQAKLSAVAADSLTADSLTADVPFYKERDTWLSHHIADCIL